MTQNYSEVKNRKLDACLLNILGSTLGARAHNRKKGAETWMHSSPTSNLEFSTLTTV